MTRKHKVHMFTLTRPNRVVVDIAAPFRTTKVKDFFLDTHRFETGTEPYTRAVTRPVPAKSPAKGALQRLFAERPNGSTDSIPTCLEP